MAKTIIIRLGKTEQYDSQNHTILWEDGSVVRWTNTYSKLQKGDTAIFLAKGKVLTAQVNILNNGLSILFDHVEEFTLSNDDFLRLNSVTPENISTVKANFHPFITQDTIDINTLQSEIRNQKLVSFYIGEENTPQLIQQLKENDRVVTIGFNKLRFLSQFKYNNLSTFSNFKTDLFGAKDYSLAELKQIHGKKDKNNNLLILDRIEAGLSKDGYYKFKTFNEYYNIIHNKLLYRDINDENEIEENTAESTNTSAMQDQPLNQIMFGPPGTGKTYTSIQKALKIINEEDEQKLDWANRNAVKGLFDKRMEEGRIVFTTFHQSMSYEDFIEGLKPLTPDVDDTFVSYDVVPGILKKICQNARSVNKINASVNWDGVDFYKMSLGGKNRPDIHEWCINNDVIALGWGGDTDLSKYKNTTDWKTFRDTFKEEFPEMVSDKRFHIQAAYTFHKMKKNDVVVISKGNHVIDAIGIVKSDYYWDDKNEFDYYHFRKVEWIAKNMNASPDQFFKKQISQMTIYEFFKEDIKLEAFKQLTLEKDSSRLRPFVLIIDEINRGNVSQIFGELITLIEEDKRQGNEEALKITLPYSKDTFSVPSNLYIIGTMNTADRSVEALDTALRRRFTFEEMMPKAELISIPSLYWRLWEKYDGLGWKEPWLSAENAFFELFSGKRIVEETEYRKLEKMSWQDWQAAIKSGDYVSFSGLNLDLLLAAINKRLEILLNKDHTIGHSYFINVFSLSDLRCVFRDKIIPLMQEYFYNDYGKIGLVLGEKFVEPEKKSNSGVFATFGGIDSDTKSELAEKLVYRLITKDWSVEDFNSIYKNA